MKTNKSFSKRLKVTKNGKILTRKKGQDHFNAKYTGSQNLHKRGTDELPMTNKDKARFLS